MFADYGNDATFGAAVLKPAKLRHDFIFRSEISLKLTRFIPIQCTIDELREICKLTQKQTKKILFNSLQYSHLNRNEIAEIMLLINMYLVEKKRKVSNSPNRCVHNQSKFQLDFQQARKSENR